MDLLEREKVRKEIALFAVGNAFERKDKERKDFAHKQETRVSKLVGLDMGEIEIYSSGKESDECTVKNVLEKIRVIFGFKPEICSDVWLPQLASSLVL